MLFRLDQYAEAKRCYESALEGFEKEDGSSEEIAAALQNIAICEVGLNQIAEAASTYERLFEHCDKNGLKELTAWAEYNIAYVYYHRGEYTRAMEFYREARHKAGEARAAYRGALCDLDQAEIYLELGLAREARDVAQLAVDEFEEQGIAYEAAKARFFLAAAAVQEGRAFAALELLEQAQESFRELKNEVWEALLDLYLALVYLQEGRSYQALDPAARAVAFFEGAGHRARAALGELILARVELQLGRLDRAREAGRSALERLGGRELPWVRHLVHRVEGEIEEAAGDTLAALRSFEEARRVSQGLPAHVHGEELKIPFYVGPQGVLDGLLWLELTTEGSGRQAEELFAWAEEAKGRMMADLIAFRAHNLPPRKPGHSSLVEEMRRLREEVNWYQRQIDVEELKAPSPGGGSEPTVPGHDPKASREARIRELRTKGAEAETRLLEALGRVRSVDRDYASLLAGEGAEAEVVREALPPGTLLLEYFEARDTLGVAVLGADDLEIVPLTPVAKVRGLLRQLELQLSKFELGPEHLERFGDAIAQATERHLAELAEELLAPVAAGLDCNHLVVVPHGHLHHLPFHALPWGEGWLIDRFTVSYAPSAAVFALGREEGAPEAEGALVLDGVLDGAASGATRRGRQGEVEAATAALGEARVVSGEEASAEALRKLGPKARWIHLATAGLERRENPMFASLRLGGSKLTLFELYNLQLDAELVALTGCGKDLTLGERGDEMIALTRGLLYAGARSLLLPLWDPPQEAAALFFRKLYPALAEETNRAEALRRAMAAVREERPHPYFWAPFILLGDPFRVA